MPVIAKIAKIFVVINSNTRPLQVGAGVAFALLLGLIPFVLPVVPPVNLLWIVIFLTSLFLKVNQSFLAVFLLIFKLLAPLAYPATSRVGEAILSAPFLQDFFTALNNLPVVPFTFFNSTLVMGGLAVGLVLFTPLTLGSTLLIKLYRDRLRERIARSKLVKGFYKIPLVGKLRGLLGNAVSFYQGIR